MVDVEAIDRRLRHMGVQIAKLRDIHARGRDRFEEDELLQAASERALQVAIQAATDIAVHVLAEDTDVTPEGYGAAFAALVPLGMIDEPLAARLASAAGLRNVLVHMYIELDRELIWDAMGRMDDLVTFASSVERYISEG